MVSVNDKVQKPRALRFACLPGQVAQSGFAPDRQSPHQEGRAALKLDSAPLLPYVINGGK